MKNNMIKNVVTFLIVAILMGGLIGGIYALTAPTIKRNRDAKITAIAKNEYADGHTFYRANEIPADHKKPDAETLSAAELKELEDYLFVFDADKNYLGLIALGEGSNSHGDIELSVAINKGHLIQSINEVSFTQTPGYGDRALKKFKEDYVNVDLSFRAVKESGATNSSNTLNDIINKIVKKYQKNKEALEKILVFGEIIIDPLEKLYGKIAEEAYADGHSFYSVSDIPADHKKPNAETLSAAELKALENYLFAFDADKNYLGLITLGDGTNPFGNIELSVAINNGHLIQSINEITFNQTTGIGSNALDKFKNEYNNVDLSFRAANVAGATVSSKTLNEIIDTIANEYEQNKETLEKILVFKEIVIDPVEQIFGTVTETLDPDFTADEVVLVRNNLKGSKLSGYTYISEKSHSFDNAGGNVKVKLYLDLNGVIKHYVFEAYEHTAGFFKNKVEAYLDSFKETNIKDVETTIAANKALTTGVTETTANVIDVILKAVKESHKTTDPIYKVFGNYTKEVDETFTATEIVTSKHTITGDVKSGVSYVGIKDYSFDTGYSDVSGAIELELYVDSEGTIVHYEYLKYEHSTSYKRKIDQYLNKFIGTKANEITTTIAENKSTYAGSTETGKNVIDVILLAIETEANK